MSFKIFLEQSNIAFVGMNSFGDVTFSINGVRYVYSTNDKLTAEKIKNVAKFQPGKALNIAKKYPFEKREKYV